MTAPEAAAEIVPAPPRRWPRRILRACRAFCFPPFYVAAALSLAAVAAFGVWVVIDAASGETLWLAAADVGGAIFFPPVFPRAAREWQWNALGSRLALLSLIGAVGALGTATVLLRLFVGRGAGRGLKGLMVATGVVGAWFALIAGFDRLEWQGLLFQMRRELPRFEAAATLLTDHWAEGGEAPGVGFFETPRADFPDSNVIPSSDSEFSMQRSLGEVVSRRPDGTLTFDHMPQYFPSERNMCMQFLPNLDDPHDWDEKDPTFGRVIHKKFERFVKLKDHWFLVWYSTPETLAE